MAHDPHSRFRQERITCEKCGDPIENAVLDDYDRYICLDCQSDEAEAAYERMCEDFHDGGSTAWPDAERKRMEKARKLK